MYIENNLPITPYKMTSLTSFCMPYFLLCSEFLDQRELSVRTECEEKDASKLKQWFSHPTSESKDCPLCIEIVRSYESPKKRSVIGETSNIDKDRQESMLDSNKSQLLSFKQNDDEQESSEGSCDSQEEVSNLHSKFKSKDELLCNTDLNQNKKPDPESTRKQSLGALKEQADVMQTPTIKSSFSRRRTKPSSDDNDRDKKSVIRDLDQISLQDSDRSDTIPKQK